MADVNMNVKILQVTKTTSEWSSVTGAISRGLLCVELDTNGKSWIKIGNGVDTYADLPYITDGAIASLGDFLRVKGVVATTSLLPATGNKVGDIYFVGDATTVGSDKFEEYVWTANSTWEFIGKISDPPTYHGGIGITIDGSNNVNLDIASDSSLGGIKVGTNLSINSTTGVLSATDTTYEFADSYNASTNKGATVATVTNAINGIDFPVDDVKIGTTSIVSSGTATIAVDGTYNSSTNKIATQSTMTGAIAALDGSITGAPGTAKTLTAFSQTDGVVSATFGDIAFPVTDVTINGTSGLSSGSTTAAFTGIAKSATINGGASIAADSSTGNIALTGIVTGLSYTNSSGSTATLTPTNGNLDVTSLILNCTL